ncbi:23S rRNA (adenine(2503)-C(2))-methyltransferase RlmN [Rubrivirga sp. S365]|uniref:Probable dual-specificity RNA methyltransferase RlmN n=1 Tax=Rubrivirga litoralis TaxID=3075598 RepID=A0ABU3BSC5_9BACT|nr:MULTISPECIES: 23S rRNA (adenine(2503)-C(2))-methyltransferase RlmN [unclassified Rubrivirga]MDT0632179.1 23S rRNA (adenine(2503)-C(2))-methyltransferase RlmN [Rubrivirga sp. F394]MDT7856789.1 23S rRNA (adenine(2503)-C(2))-methyltransferase RlmN [Rubrivirga sp. S365]
MSTPRPSGSPRPDLRALDQDALEALAVEMGEPRFRGRQLFKWVHEKGARSFADMTDLPAAFRERLEEAAAIGTLVEARRQQATDGTIKSLFRLPSGRHVETVLIPDLHPDGRARRLTVCVSSQVGCAMGCTFCATGLMGFQENLTAGQIAGQVHAMEAVAQETWGRGVSNVVYMGMGEPLQNYRAVVASTGLICSGLGLSPKRITVSTVGLARRIRQLADDQAEGTAPPVGLAISLHAPTDPQRSAIMPVNRSEKTDLSALEDAVRHYHARTGRPVTYEYCMFAGTNDSDADARRLARVAAWAPSKVNLIMYNPVEGTDFAPSSEERLDGFIRTLVGRGVRVTVRRSRGQDIDAACGQLAVAEG